MYCYLYIDPSRNDEIIYVGKGKNNRSHDHLRRKDRHPLTQRIQKMLREGIQPLIKKIDCSTDKIAFDLEIGLIKIIGRKDLGKGSLLNLTNGGDGGPVLFGDANPMRRKEISEKFLGDNNPMRRKEVSDKFRGNNNPMKDPINKAKYVNARKGKSHRSVIWATVCCVHCNKIGKLPAMHRWHFDKCKHKNLKYK